MKNLIYFIKSGKVNSKFGLQWGVDITPVIKLLFSSCIGCEIISIFLAIYLPKTLGKRFFKLNYTGAPTIPTNSIPIIDNGLSNPKFWDNDKVTCVTLF